MAPIAPEFHQIRLELAREPGHPEGSNSIGFELTAPLDGNGRLSAEVWRKNRDRCRVRRFADDEPDRIGRLARRPGGSWYFDYDAARRDDDEAGFRLGDERFVVGEYVSIRDDEDRMHTYRIVSVVPL